MDEETLKKVCDKFRKVEGPASFYDVALEIVDAHPLQASIIILAVWNSGRYRFAASDIHNLVDLQRAIKESGHLFKKIERKDFKTVDFDEIGDTVKEIYSMLSKVKGVEYTGASKVMHLLNRELFVMWDKYVRDEYVPDTTSEDYLKFLKEMQEKFKDVTCSMSNRTFAKAIDEYNQVTITFPKREKEKQKHQPSKA